MPAESPTPAPVPAPAPPAPTRGRDPLWTGLALIVVTFIGIVAVMVVHAKFLATPTAPATPVVDARALGQAYAADLGAACGDGFEAAARSLALGRTMADAQKDQQAEFLRSRTDRFERSIGVELARIITPGTEPATDTQRVAVGRFFTDLAVGLKGSK